MNEITIGDKTYISSKRAAEITGYAKDYVGQLCREGYVDAKMVGRSWYVYEPSIRAHRFGEEAIEEEQASKVVDEEPVQVAQEVRTTEVVTTWEQPRYHAEEPVHIPSLDIRAEGAINRMEDPEYAPEVALTDMQQAWKEWFELRNQQSTETSVPEEEGEVEETEDEEEEEYEEGEEIVEFQRIHEPEEEESGDVVEEDEVEEIHIERIYRHEVVQPPVQAVVQPAPTARSQVRHEQPAPKKQKVEGAAVSIAALFIAIAIISVTIAAIGSGVATPYLQTFVGSNPVIEYLGGSRSIND